MQPEQIKQKIAQHIPATHIEVSGEGNMFDVIVVSEEFAGKTPVKKQQMVYAAVNDDIISGAIHALTIKTYTPQQWQTASQLKIG